VPMVVEDENADLQLTAEELRQAELAEATWPQKELAAILQRRYASGEVRTGQSEAVVSALDAQAVRQFHAGKAERIADKRRVIGAVPLERELGAKRSKQAVDLVSHEDKLGEILRKTAELREAEQKRAGT
jgi:hypothetical protein